MLGSGSAGLLKREPKRLTAFRTRSDAVAWMGGHRRRKRYALVVLLLQTSVYPDGRTEVVPEFPIKALGDRWSLPAMEHEDHLAISGVIPEVLYYFER